MPFYTVQAIIPTTDNVAANYATNTWHFEADDLTALNSAFTAMKAFYNSVGTYLNSMVRQTNWEFKAYDDTDPEPRAPVDTEVWNLTPTPSGDGLPPEVALCISFQGNAVSGVPQARKRGRLYLPFFKTSANGADGRPTSTVCNAIAAAGDTLMTAGLTSGTWSWLVFSRVAPGYTLVTNGWVNNEWDTQRRRGRAATTRSVWT